MNSGPADGGNLMSCRLSVGPHIFIKGAPWHWNLSRLGAPFPFRCRNGSNPATSLTAVRRTSRPWSTSYDTALPMLRSRSVTGWPHHLIPQLCRVPASTGRSPKPPRPGAAPGRHGAAHASISLGMWLDKEGTCFASSLMRERYPPSPPLSLGVVPASRL